MKHECRRNGDTRLLTMFSDFPDEKEVRLDSCIAHEVAVLNHSESPTLASCCGHGRYQKTIVVPVSDDENSAMEWFTKIIIPRKRRFYVRDAEGFYYIPEVEMFAGTGRKTR